MIKLQLNHLVAEQHFNNVKNIIQNRIENVLRSGIKRNKVSVNIDITLKNYLTALLDPNNLKDLILAPPENLNGLINSIKRYYPDFLVQTHDSNFVLRNIFIDNCYNKDTFDKLKFITSISIDTCPYCNRNYIYYLSKSNKIKPQIDHFYPKSTYPFLGISFYNLIPSCQTCNGFGAKEEKDPLVEDLVHPYLLENNNFKFSFRINSINFLNSVKDKSSVSVLLTNKLQGHLTVFKLDKLYEQHSDHVIELITKSKIKYSERYRKYLFETFPDLNFDDNFIDRMILGNYSTEDEIHKRPLAKLYQDIGKELGLIP